ncbi:MAG: acyl-CoA thioesterase [Planctomycetota bacterium]
MSADRQNPAIRVILLPRDTNASGTIFGGVILSYIDLAAVVEATKVNPRHRYVTVAMKEVVFHEPVFVGDLISFYTRLGGMGRTSLCIKVDVFATRREDPLTEIQVTEAEVTYVAVDENRRPIPVLDPESSP